MHTAVFGINAGAVSGGFFEVLVLQCGSSVLIDARFFVQCEVLQRRQQF